MSPHSRFFSQFIVVLVSLCLFQLSSSVPLENETFPATLRQESSAEDNTGSLREFVSGWWGLFVTVASSFPWAIVAVFDAVDGTYRTRDQVARRLLLSSACLLLAYSSGLLFAISLTVFTIQGVESGREDEVATVLVLLVFNLWHVARNVRGWLQFYALRKLDPMFVKVQTNFGRHFPLCTSDGIDDLHAGSNGTLSKNKLSEENKNLCIQGLTRLRISERLIDNDWKKSTPFLNPFFAVHSASRTDGRNIEYEAWAVAMWRAWWTQDILLLGLPANSLEEPKQFRCSRETRHVLAANLLESDPAWPIDRDVVDDDTGKVVTSKEEWATCLTKYGWDKERDGGVEGQQDSHGATLPPLFNLSDARGIAVMVQEKTMRQPNRMSGLWYDTVRFEEVYEEVRTHLRIAGRNQEVLFPSLSAWQEIAQDIGTHLDRPVFLSDAQLINFAGELASASMIIVRFEQKYAQLVDLIYEDGRNARWTFGWSGLLACFSHLWTKERIYIAMLNGLSLLALSSSDSIDDLDENVRSMLYGYAAFEVSDRAVGKRIAEDRNRELLRRYTLNKGKTCRGSGVCATRLACKELGIPGEASHMDGLPAFSTGWASEYLERKPGNQTPEHGRNHNEVEDLHGSSNVWRYPHSHA